MNRRRFLQHSVAATASLGFPAVVQCASPNSLLQVACIGVSRMGGNTMRSVASHPKVKIVALCDVDAGHLAGAAKDFSTASRHKDWRELLAKDADKFDAVTIGTPDHMHAPMAVTALRLKKHVYLQKPMAPTIHECRVIKAEAAKAGVITQLGNQGRSSIDDRTTVDLLRSGVIGRIKEVIKWENKALNWWPKNTEFRTQADAMPEGFDWNLWLGIRADRPYLHDTYHPQTWRALFDFGVGEMGDMGCHHFDTTVDALRLGAPLRVRQVTDGSKGPLWASKRKVEMEFAGTAFTVGDTLKITWTDGGIDPDMTKVVMPKVLTKFPLSGTFWMGEKGSIFKPFRSRPYVLPEESFPAEKYPRDYKGRDHYHDWVDAILEGRQACSHFDHGAALTETVLVGTLADRFPNQWLEWDQAAMKVTNVPEANALVTRSYREGWKIEGLG